MKAKIMQY